MDLNFFDKKILLEYTNKVLNKKEIEDICNKAIKLRIIDESDIKINDIPEMNTIDLLKFIRKSRNSYLNTSLPNVSDSFISAKYHSPIDNKQNKDHNINNDQNVNNDHNRMEDDKTKSPFYTHKKEFFSPASKFNSPLICKNSNIENPFTNETELMSFCEDLRTKNNSIKKKADLKSSKLVSEVIDSFIEYKLKKKKEKKGVYKILLIVGICILVYFLYNPVPT